MTNVGRGEMEQATVEEIPPSQLEDIRREAELERAYMAEETARVDALLANTSTREQYLEHRRKAFIETRKKEKKLEQAAGMDPKISELYNSKRFKELAIVEIERAWRTGRSFVLLLGDCDNFRGVNDRYGHPGGDRAIKNMGEEVAKNARLTDIKGRIGGDEFAAVLPESDVTEGILVASRIREGASKNALAGIKDKQNKPARGNKTMSWAVVVVTPDMLTNNHADDYERLYSLVDGALYFAKGSGRDCIAVSNSGSLSIIDPTIEASILQASLSKASNYPGQPNLHVPSQPGTVSNSPLSRIK